MVVSALVSQHTHHAILRCLSADCGDERRCSLGMTLFAQQRKAPTPAHLHSMNMVLGLAIGPTYSRTVGVRQCLLTSRTSDHCPFAFPLEPPLLCLAVARGFFLLPLPWLSSLGEESLPLEPLAWLPLSLVSFCARMMSPRMGPGTSFREKNA